MLVDHGSRAIVEEHSSLVEMAEALQAAVKEVESFSHYGLYPGIYIAWRFPLERIKPVGWDLSELMKGWPQPQSDSAIQIDAPIEESSGRSDHSHNYFNQRGIVALTEALFAHSYATRWRQSIRRGLLFGGRRSLFGSPRTLPSLYNS